MTRLALTMTLAVPVMLAHASIELRGGSTVEAPIESVSIEGVRVGGSAPRTISWDRVKTITGEHASEALEYEEISGAAWRARTRLARGDAVMAEPLFAWLYELYVHEDNPTAQMVAEGYLQCLLDRAAQAEAVAPWLDTVSAGASLHPALPPIFEDSVATRTLAGSGLPNTMHAADGSAPAMAWWYTEAARLDSGLTPQLPTTRPSEPDAEGSDLWFVEQLVSCRSGDEAVRRRSRTALGSLIEREHGSWREAWARAAVGRSLLLEDDETSRSLGIIELLHVPARFAHEQPALAAIALREAAGALRDRGDDTGASELLRLLPSIDPSRPAPPPRPRSTHVQTDINTNGPLIADAGQTSPTDTRSADRP